MKKTRLLPLLLAGMLALFTSCDASDGKVGDNSSSHSSSSSGNPIGDAASDVGDAVSDVGEGIGDVVSDLGDDVSNGLNGMTDGDSHSDKTESDKREDASESSREDESYTDSTGSSKSVTAMEPVTAEKKTGLI